MESQNLQRLDVSWGHEPGRRLQSGTGFQPVSPEQAGCLCHFLRFMERGRVRASVDSFFQIFSCLDFFGAQSFPLSADTIL
ncbi:MAG: hypothetical protein DME18_16970 [Verrucomicrobia bacterium]|nr:MAG: hypothetical protein DME18_16970 [Verrucomicrobiota bacterium]